MEPKEYVMMLLKNRNRMVMEIAALKFELKRFVKTNDDDLIEEMVLSSKQSERVRSDNLSDKTAGVALRYQEIIAERDQEAFRMVSHRLDLLETAVNRLDFYMDQLDHFQVDVLRSYYIENKTWRDLQKSLDFTIKTLRKVRDAGLDYLAERYKLLFSLSIVSQEELGLFS